MLAELINKPCADRVKAKDKPCKHFLKAETKSVGTCRLPDNFLCIESARNMYPRMSYSQANTFQRCRYAYYLRYIKGIRLKMKHSSAPMKMGLAWDDACNKYHETGRLELDEEYCDEIHLHEKSRAKVRSIIRAINELDINVANSGYAAQHEINKQVCDDGPFILAKYDGMRVDGKSFIERKFTASRDTERYFNIHNLNGQIATYFMLEPQAKTCIMQVVRLEQLRKKQSESDEEFAERFYDNAILKPKQYFPGYKTGGHTFGRVYYRHEFDIEAERLRYKALAGDIKGCAKRCEWVRNRNSCQMYGVNYPCDYMPICDGKGVNEELYKYAGKEGV